MTTKRWHLWALRVALSTAIVCAGAPAGAATCVLPKASALVGDRTAGFVEHVTVRPFQFHGKALRWVAVSWGAPQDGVLFVLDCQGHQLARFEDLGYVERLRIAPAVLGDPALRVSYVPATGTEINERSDAIIQFDGSSISKLWAHSTFDGSYYPLTPGAQEVFKYSWRYRDGHDRIEVAATYTDARRTRSMPTEHYCLRRKARKYLSCQ